MKNWLENLIIFSIVSFVIVGPYLLPKFMYGLTETMPLIIYRIVLIFSPSYLGALSCSLLSRNLCPEGGLECLWLMYPVGITLLSYLISLLWYVITFKHTGKASKKGLGRKIKHFVPWFVYVYGLALLGWFIFCLIAGYINFVLATPALVIFAVIWFFVTWKIGKRISS